MTEKELKAIKARADTATPGPWYSFDTDDDVHMSALGVASMDFEPWFAMPDHGNGHEHVVAMTLIQSPRFACHASGKWAEDAEFIAHARTDIPALLAEIDQLKRQLTDYTAALQFVVDMPFGAPLASARCQGMARATLKKWQPTPRPGVGGRR